MEMSFTENLRRAHRFVAAYEARVLDGFGLLADRLAQVDFQSRGWGTVHHQLPPAARTADWSRRWIWDFLPLSSARAWWQRGDKEQGAGVVHVVVEHILDTAHQQWMDEKRPGVPDPLTFATQPAETLWRARWFVNGPGPISDALWNRSWEQLGEHVAEGMPAATIARPRPDQGVIEAQRDGLSAGAFAVASDDLVTSEDFVARLVDPLLAQLPSLDRR